MHQQHNEDVREAEPDVYYLVPNKYGPGKTVVRRPRPPPTSAPLDDDFDAATTRGARTEWDGPTHRLERARSPSPPTHNKATITKAFNQGSSSALKSQSPVPSAVAGTSGPRRRDDARPISDGVQDNSLRESNEVYGDYGRYIHELERKFGESPDLTLSPSRSRKDQGSGAQVLKTSTTNGNANMGNRKIGYPAPLGSLGRAGGAAVAAAVGPRPRQSFEMVNRRVLEDGPERTVTISTWREQVADEADQYANMDIYYLDAHAYAAEAADTIRQDGEDDDDDSEEATSVPEVDNHRVRRRRSLPSPPQRDGNTGSDPGSIRTISDERSESAPASVRPTTSTATTSTRTRKSSNRSRSQRRRSSTSGSRPGLWNPTPPQTPPRPLIRDPEPEVQRGLSPLSHVLHGSAAGSRSSPSRSATTPPVRQSPDHTHHVRPPPKNTPRSSTPNRTYTRQSASSFHPTQSGSTISTIKSASTIALERILDSCDPSLLHLSPALARLGIVNDHHLRAIARLSDETRDRELKDAALKQGITVMEWAIFLDKLHTL